MQATNFREQFTDVADARALAQGIVDTVREPLVVLNAELRVLTANRSFYQTFHVSLAEIEGRPFFELGNRQWEVPRLRQLLEEVLPLNQHFNDFAVDLDTVNDETVCW